MNPNIEKTLFWHVMTIQGVDQFVQSDQNGLYCLYNIWAFQGKCIANSKESDQALKMRNMV